MARQRKTQKLGDIYAKAISNAFSEMADNNIFWISKSPKEGGGLYNVCRGIDIDKLNEEFSDDMYFNLWSDMTDLDEKERAEVISEVASAFYGTGYYLGTKYPHTSKKDSNKVSLRILAREE
tara:strand:- start:2331 stop:2696 length:366 start_codon:yes stop_codon:yes gene_type:complete